MKSYLKNHEIVKKFLSVLLAFALVMTSQYIPNLTLDVEAAEADGTEVYDPVIYPGGKLVDGSSAWNSQGGGEITLYDDAVTNVYFTNDPFQRDESAWSNFVIETTAPAGTKGYTLRADDYGWTYGEGAEPEKTSTHSEGVNFANHEQWKNICIGDMMISAQKKDANTLVFTIQFADGINTLTYTLSYADGIPADLKFYVGADGGKVTLNKITFTKELPDLPEPQPDSGTDMSEATVNKLYSQYFGTDKVYDRVTVHDPSIVIGYEDQATKKVYPEDGSGRQKIYCIFGSHMAWAYSYDMKNWTIFQNNINKDYAAIFAKEAKWSALGNKNYDVSGNLWAPDVVWNPTMNKWCMYMSVNGDNYYTSIVLLTADDLKGDWTYEGPVVYSGFTFASDANAKSMTDLFDIIGSVDGTSTIPQRYKQNRNGRTATYGMNAIDACVFFDNGKLWMTYGSWFGGIYMLELDPATGYRKKDHIYTTKEDLTEDIYQGIKIAGGNGQTGEASYIEKIGDRYYLFMSYGGFVATGGYNMRVFSSDNVTGPYKDLSGDDARYYKEGSTIINDGKLNTTGTVGSRLMSYYKWSFMQDGFVAQGHNSAVVDTDGKAFNVYHTRRDDGTEGHSVRVHQTFVAKNHGLVTAPFEYSGETLASTAYEQAKAAGKYQILYMDPGKSNNNLTCVQEETLELKTDGSIAGTLNGKTVTGTWTQAADGPYLTMQAGGVTYQGVFLEQNIEETACETMCFTVVGGNDVAVWGYQNPSDKISIAYNAKNIRAEVVDEAFIGATLDFNKTGYFGAVYTWEPLDTALISKDGVVQPVAQDTNAQVRLTITKGDYSHSKIITIKIHGDESKNQLLPIGSDLILDEYTIKTQFNNAVPNSDISQNTGLSLSFFVKGVTSDWTSMLVAQGELEIGLSTLTRRGNDAWCNFNESQTEKSPYASELYPNNIHEAFYNNSYYVTISANTDGSISYYRDGNLMLTYGAAVPSIAGTMNSTISDVASKMIECYQNGTLKFVYNHINNIVVGYGADYDPSSQAVIEGYDYYADYDTRGKASDWKKGAGNGVLSMGHDTVYGNYIQMAPGSDSGNRGAELNFNSKNSASEYIVELDTSLTGGLQDNRSVTQFAIVGDDVVYSDNNTNNGITSGYILKLASPTYLKADPTTRTTYYINDDMDNPITIKADTWVHIKAHIVGKTVGLTITDNTTGAKLYQGMATVNGNGAVKGLYVLSGRTNGVIKVDNIKTYEWNNRQPGIHGDVETLTGTKWWDGSETGQNYALTGNGSLVLYVRADALDKDNYGAFSVELKGEPNNYLTTGSDKNAWLAEGSVGAGTIEGISDDAAQRVSTLQKDHTYRITVTKAEKNITVEYYDMTTDQEYWTVKWLNGNMPDTFQTHIIAQVGTYSVWQKETLKGTEWWANTQTGQDYALNGDGSLVLDVRADALDESSYGAFNVELKGEPNCYLTTGSDKNAWSAEGSADVGNIEGVPEEAQRGSALQKDHTYRIIITRIEQDITIEYYDLTEAQSYWTMKWTDGNMPDTFSAHIIAQIGTYTVQRIHTYQSEITKGSACEDGIRTYTCTVCGDVYEEAITGTGHDYKVKSFDSGAADIVCSHCGGGFTITLDADQGIISDQYTIETNAAEIILPTADEIARAGFSFYGWKDSMGAAVTKIDLSDFSKETAADFVLTASWRVFQELTGSISLDSVEGGLWDQLLNKITFGLYHTNQKEVIIEAAGSGNVTITYLIVTEKPFERTAEELAALADSSWKLYDRSNPAILNTDSRCVVYAKLTDEAGQVLYISSDGIIEDETAPGIQFETITSSLTDSSVSFSAESNEDGTYYFALYEDSADTLKNTDFASEVISHAQKTGKLTAGTAVTIPAAGLKKATDYNAYLVVKDKAGNISTRQQFIGTLQSMIEVTDAAITGNFVYGEVLSADASNEQNIEDYSFQWYRSDKPITKDTDVSALTLIGRANRGIYTLGKEDVGKYIAVVIAVLDETYGGSALAYSTALVQCKEITAVVTIEDKVYDGSNEAHISNIELTGVLARDTVTAEAENAVFDNADAGENKQVSVTGIALEGEDASYYQLASTRATAAATIKKAPKAPNAPSNSSVWNVANSIETVGSVTGLPDGWSWSETDQSKILEVGKEETVTAVYVKEDAGNYEIISVEITLKRSHCNHNKTEIRNKVDATCMIVGYTGDIYCLECEETIQTGSEISAFGHDYDEGVVTKNATCTEAGEMTYTCTRCSDSYTKDIKPFGHTEVKDSAVEPTCTNIGLTEGSHCSVCGEVLAEQSPIQKLPHAYGEGVVTKQPTAEAEGVRTFTCSVCGGTRTEAIPKLPTPDHKHEYVTEIVAEPTCTENGKKVSACSCGDKIEEILPALGHTKEIDPAIAPTCTGVGKTEGSHCSVCGEVLVKQDFVPASGHSYGEGVVTKEPTIEEEGVRTFTCSVCGDIRVESISKLPTPDHKHDYTITITEAACTKDGEKIFTCSCGDSYRETIKALGHDYKDEITKQPTYSEAGVRTFTCSRCNDSYTEEIPRLTPVPTPLPGISNPSNANQGISTPDPSETEDNTDTSTPPAEEPDKSDGTGTVEIKPDGTKVETTVEEQPDGTKVETIVEEQPDGTKIETITETRADGSITDTKEVTAADNSATLSTVAKTDANGQTTVSSVIKTGVSDSSDIVRISENLLQEIAADDRMNSVVIEITDTTVQSAAASGRKQTVVTVEIPAMEGVSIEKVVLTKESIDTAKETGKGLKVNVVSSAKSNILDHYSVVIPVKQLAKIDSSIKEINVTVYAERVANVAKNDIRNTVTKVLNKSKGKKDKTCVVSLASNETVRAGMKVTIPVTEKTAIAKGSKVYVYKYDEKTGKLVETANCKKTVSQDGSVVLAASSGTDYVISAKKLSGSKVQTIKDSIAVSASKKTVRAGKTIRMKISLPDTVSTKSEFGTEKAVITYKSSDSKVASVSKSGVVTAKKSGTVTIKTVIKLASGQKVTKEQKITIK